MPRKDLVWKTDLDAALAALVDSSPTTLDTLKELATALGNDPNFAASVAGQIGAKYTKPGAGIPKADLVAAVQTSLGLADTAAQPASVDAKYTKPGTGIPLADLAAAVATSLGKADTALQASILTALGASPLIAGKFYAAVSTGGPLSNSLPLNSLRMGRMLVGRSCTLTSITVEVFTAGSAGAVTRLGIFALNTATGLPTLLLDAGTVDATTTGVKTVSISQAVTQGQNIMLAAVNQGAPATVPIIRTNAGEDRFIGDAAATVSGSLMSGLTVAGVTDALPSSPTPTVSGSGFVPRVLVSAAA